MKDERIRELMIGFGMEHSRSLYCLIQQVCNEVEQEIIKKLIKSKNLELLKAGEFGAVLSVDRKEIIHYNLIRLIRRFLV